MQPCCQPLALCSNCQPPTARPWSSPSGQERVLWVCKVCGHQGLWQPSMQPRPQLSRHVPLQVLCGGLLPTLDVVLPCP